VEIKMTQKQMIIYGARLRLAWFEKATELGSAKAACKYYGIERSTYYYWHKRWIESGKNQKSLYDQSRKPKTNPRAYEDEVIDLIVKLRTENNWGKSKIQFVLGRDYGIKVSDRGINNNLHRLGLIKKKHKKKRISRNYWDYPYYPGERLQLDVKHLKRDAYQYSIIDCATRIKFKYIYDNITPQNTVDFVLKAKRFFDPAFLIEIIQTDNGCEFTYNHFLQIKRTHPLDELLQELGIEHILIPPASPNINGRVERSHRTDQREVYSKLDNFSDILKLKKLNTEHCIKYNTYRPHESLANKTPLQYLNSLEGYETANLDFSVLNV
jgi:transposase InsO family protein